MFEEVKRKTKMVRFYCDVPEYVYGHGCSLFAATQPPTHVATPGTKRIAFEVELPPEVWNEADYVSVHPAPSVNVQK